MIAHAPYPVLIQGKTRLLLEGTMKHGSVSDNILPEQGHEMTPTEGKAGNSTPSSQSLTRHQTED